MIRSVVFQILRRRVYCERISEFVCLRNNVRCLVRTFTDQANSNAEVDVDFNCDYTAIVDNNEESRKLFCIIRLKNIFEISADEAEKLYDSHLFLQKLSAAVLQENVEIAQKEGFQKSVLQNNPWILALEEGKLKYCVNVVKKYHEDVNKVAPLLKIPFHKFRLINAYAQKDATTLLEGSRIKYLSDKLQCCPSVISEALVKHDIILRMPLIRVQTVTELMLEICKILTRTTCLLEAWNYAGIQPEDILKDLWSYRHSITTLKNRLSQAKAAEIKHIKPWMARSIPEAFRVTLKRHVQNRIILAPHSCGVEYLSERLQCSVEEATYIATKTPALKRTHVSKLKKMIDFLYEEGFSAEQIRSVPRVLCHSHKTVKIRLKELRMYGYNPTSLHILCKSAPVYNSFVNKLLQTC